MRYGVSVWEEGGMGNCGRQETYGEAATRVQREEQACIRGTVV